MDLLQMGLGRLDVPVAYAALTNLQRIKGGMAIPDMVVGLSPGAEHGPTGGSLVAAPGLVALVRVKTLPFC